MADEPAEVLPEEAREHDEREQDRREDGQALDDEVQAVRDGREVDVHRAGEEILVAVDQVGDADQVVEDVSEVTLGLGVAARQARPLRRRAGSPRRAAGRRRAAADSAAASCARSPAGARPWGRGRSRPRHRRCARRSPRAPGRSCPKGCRSGGRGRRSAARAGPACACSARGAHGRPVRALAAP